MPQGPGTYGTKRGRPPVKKAKGGKAVPSSAETSVIKGASVAGSREGSTIKGPKAKDHGKDQSLRQRTVNGSRKRSRNQGRYAHH